MAGDQISEGYKGFISDRMTINSRRRVDWIVEQIIGESALDIGCSQGIVSILAARQGRHVVGIDNNPESVKYALEDKNKESKSVQELITFICDDFIKHDFGDDRFDSIILGEIIEHLEEPDVFVAKTKRLLTRDGRIIVSVPFGINRHPDHKKTYYFYDLFELLDEYFDVTNVYYMGKWIAMIAATKGISERKVIINETVVRELEVAILALEEDYEKKEHDLKKRIRDLENRLLRMNQSDTSIIAENKYRDLYLKTNEAYRRYKTAYEKKNAELEDYRKTKAYRLSRLYARVHMRLLGYKR